MIKATFIQIGFDKKKSIKTEFLAIIRFLFNEFLPKINFLSDSVYCKKIVSIMVKHHLQNLLLCKRLNIMAL